MKKYYNGAIAEIPQHSCTQVTNLTKSYKFCIATLPLLAEADIEGKYSGCNSVGVYSPR